MTKPKTRLPVKLKEFGHGSSAHEYGYDLPLLLGWLEEMAEAEEEGTRATGKKRDRLNLVWDAITKLNEALEVE